MLERDCNSAQFNMRMYLNLYVVVDKNYVLVTLSLTMDKHNSMATF